MDRSNIPLTGFLLLFLCFLNGRHEILGRAPGLHRGVSSRRKQTGSAMSNPVEERSLHSQSTFDSAESEVASAVSDC